MRGDYTSNTLRATQGYHEWLENPLSSNPRPLHPVLGSESRSGHQKISVGEDAERTGALKGALDSLNLTEKGCAKTSSALYFTQWLQPTEHILPSNFSMSTRTKHIILVVSCFVVGYLTGGFAPILETVF